MDLATTTDLTFDEAKSITNSIRQYLEISLVYIKKAYAGRAWLALGHPNWDTYCAEEFGDRFRLGRDDRREAVIELSDAGLSTRAIAAATGASKSTVAADIAGVQNRTPDDDEVVGLDGKTYPRPKPKPKPPETIDDGWKKWLYAINRVLTDGARMAERTEVENIELGAHSGLAQLIYSRLTERKIDAEIRELFDADDASVIDATEKFMPSTVQAERKRETDRAANEAAHLDMKRRHADRAIPQPPKMGPRRKHAQVLEAASASLAGMCMALDEITELDNSVTAEMSGRLADELDAAIESVERVSHLLGLSRLRGQIEVEP